VRGLVFAEVWQNVTDVCADALVDCAASSAPGRNALREKSFGDARSTGCLWTHSNFGGSFAPFAVTWILQALLGPELAWTFGGRRPDFREGFILGFHNTHVREICGSRSTILLGSIADLDPHNYLKVF